MSEIERPRLYHIKKFSLEEGYGFTVRKQPSDLYAVVDNVETNSPADRVGLRVGDILVEINYYNVIAESYKDIMKIIRYGLEVENDKVFEHEVVLLVVSQASYDYFEASNSKIKSENLEKVQILSK